jgi:two-component system, cell cycle sensor histidine kinase DivJ
VGFFAPVCEHVDSPLHASARRNALTASRHRAFIVPRVLGCAMALAALPVYVGLRGAPSLHEAAVFAGLAVPVLIAGLLCRTGQYERAHMIASLALAGIVTAVAVETGGIGSIAALWLIAVPLEAMLSASRRVVALAVAATMGGAIFLLLGDYLGHLGYVAQLPAVVSIEQQRAALAALGIISAAFYAAGIAFSVAALGRDRPSNAEEERYRSLASSMADVITRHARDGKVQFVSPAAEQLFGTKVQNLVGYGLFDRVHVADRPAYLSALSDSAAYGRDRSVEFRVRQEGDLSKFAWIEMRCHPVDQAVADKRGKREVVAVMRDITERKEQEVVLEEARAEAQRANDAKSWFLATMSHELRTPLNAIIGFSEMLTKEASLMIDAEKRHNYAQLINESGHHLLSVVNGILDMSKIESGNFKIVPEPFDPRRVIDDCCELLGYRARDLGIELRVEITGDLAEIVADKRSLHQIMLNLVSNAIKFTNRGGAVTVRAQSHADHIKVIVEDTGIGIGAEDLSRVGDPFFQARSSYDRRHDGTGLGLSIVKGLLSLQGGQLEIVSKLGEGTRVTVSMPLDCKASGRRSEVVSLDRQSDRATDEILDNRVRISA